MKNKLYFIGYGNMAEAIYQRIDKKLFGKIFLIEKNSERRVYINEKNYKKTQVLKELNGIKFNNSDIVLLAVKPNQIKSVCEEINSLILGKKDIPIIISIAAGVTTTAIKNFIINNLTNLQNDIDIFRAMPNLCARDGEAITGLYGKSKQINKSNLTTIISKIFKSIGEILWVKKESDLDIVTAISGSGPAYIFYFIDTMIKSAVELGLDKKNAKKLVIQTVIGSGKAGISIDNFAEQISKVASKGGTTEAAINLLNKKNLDVIFTQAIKAAYSKSKEISLP
ncbi:pyrroline-5-carboxylate reductase [Methylophilaceae bacterium]|jgi:pyrroline-5-carboxylate reductase|nr:pyrroline-5-carboxylate reductase [Nitrosomonadales bacterium]MBT6356450.1 pyrroline-5-carboxylate reductase [Nitrosomonadales bacterium]MDC1109501.1 pyrroline-5-carboxylate reductase [Methylophilaceae bacterium]